MKEEKYYLGLDIGTNSLGYAVSDERYHLRRCKGELAWGTTLFESAALAEERRTARTARRRLDRRQQRVALLEELFALEIGKVDLNFFLRRHESALFPEDSKAGVKLFDGGIADGDYHKRYPTIHHLIVELMKNSEPHDVRLIYLACAWLVRHRGHFLFDVTENQAIDFGKANAVHLTQYAFCRKGELFKQKPVKAKSGLVPRKAGGPLGVTEKYGGYNKTTASFYLLASYTMKGKKDVIFVPIELMYAERVMADEYFAAEYISDAISSINGGKPVEDVHLLLGGRKIKINTVIEADGMRMVLKGKTSGGAQITVSPCVALLLGADMERYVKRLEVFAQKRKEGANIQPDAEHDRITAEENLALYDIPCDKLTNSSFMKCPGNTEITKAVVTGREKFTALVMEDQIACLLSIVSWFGNVQTCDLESIGGAKKSGSKVLNSRLAAWKKWYSDVRIVDVSASGLFEARSENLLELL